MECASVKPVRIKPVYQKMRRRKTVELYVRSGVQDKAGY